MDKEFCDQLDFKLITWAVIDICLRQCHRQHQVLAADTVSGDKICTAFRLTIWCRLNDRWDFCRWFSTSEGILTLPLRIINQWGEFIDTRWQSLLCLGYTIGSHFHQQHPVKSPYLLYYCVSLGRVFYNEVD